MWYSSPCVVLADIRSVGDLEVVARRVKFTRLATTLDATSSRCSALIGESQA